MISVVIPVYNTGKKLNKCLDSLTRQTFRDWECYLVNDFSTDELTVQILKNWVGKDKRFILIDNPHNMGIERSRFIAVNQIMSNDRSQYLMFMDHDDWLYSKESLYYLYNNACNSGADVVVGRHNDAYNLIQVHSYNPVPSGLIEQPQLKDKYFLSHFGVNLIPVSMWARLYKLDLIRRAGLTPKGLIYTDDNAWNLFLLPYTNSLLMLDKVVYVHRWGGLSSKNDNKGLKEYKHFYKIRRKAIIDFDYEKGRLFLDCELKNVLAATLFSAIVYSNQSKSDIIHNLQVELLDEIWKEVDETIQYRKDEFSQALYKRDCNRMYEIQYRQSKMPINVIKQLIKKSL